MREETRVTTTNPSPPAASNGHGAAGAAPPKLAPPPAAAKPADRLPTGRRRRRPAMAALAVLIIVGCGALAGALAVGGKHSVSVLALAHSVKAGQQVGTDDLRVAHVSGSGLSAVSASAKSTLVGETATASLPAGTLLVDGMLTARVPPEPGARLVAVALKAGAAPVQARPGRRVVVLSVPADDGRAASKGGPVLAPAATVISAHRDRSARTTNLSLQVDAGRAAAVARAAAAGTLALAVLPAGAR
jgi:hypothetical protein